MLVDETEPKRDDGQASRKDGWVAVVSQCGEDEQDQKDFGIYDCELDGDFIDAGWLEVKIIKVR